MHLRLLTAAGLAAAALSTVGCGTQLNADSSCASYLNASQSSQDDAVSRIAADMHAGSAVTPLGRPNINYLCARHPDDMTLGDAVRATG